MADGQNTTPGAAKGNLREELVTLSERLRAAAQAGEPLSRHFSASDPVLAKLVDAIETVRDVGDVPVNKGELNEVVRRRTAELDHARSVAEYSSRAKSDFLARMSHELRTPLNAIIGFAQLLLETGRDPMTERQIRQVGHILTGGRHLLGLINDVLDLSGIEAGRMETHIEPVDPRDLIAESLQMTVALEKQYPVRIENRLADDVPMPNVACDFLRAKQCLINFINNACKYNRDDGLVWVSAKVVDGDRVRFLVGDTGIGIPADRHHELFRPFSRLGREASEVEGSGVGLALTKMLIYAMEGTVDFESEQGKGSTFWFELPVTEEAVEAPQPIRKITPVTGDMVGCILIIEDSAANVQLIKDILEPYDDIELIAASTGEEGVELAISRRPDIVLTDVNLSGMSGLDVVRYLRNVKETGDMPVFAVSADARGETRQRCFEAGMNGFFAKPVDVADLTQSIAGTLHERRLSVPNAGQRG